MVKQMAKRERIAWIPGDRYYWGADDDLRLTRREQVKLAIGIAVAAFVGVLIVFAVSLA